MTRQLQLRTFSTRILRYPSISLKHGITCVEQLRRSIVILASSVGTSSMKSSRRMSSTITSRAFLSIMLARLLKQSRRSWGGIIDQIQEEGLRVFSRAFGVVQDGVNGLSHVRVRKDLDGRFGFPGTAMA